jgi:hypothetical protein
VQFVVLFIVAMLWALYLVSWAKSRTEHRSVDSISTFNKHLSVLERTTPGRSSAPTRIAGSPVPQRAGASLARPAFAPTNYRPAGSVMSRRQARERRKNVLCLLAGAAVVTLTATVFVGGPMLYLQLLTDLLLVGYVVALVQMRRLAEERQQKVRYLPTAPERPASQPLALHQSAN